MGDGLGDDIDPDLAAIYDQVAKGADPAWLARYDEASWYAAIMLFGLYPVDTDNLDDVPEEYRWPGTRRPQEPDE